MLSPILLLMLQAPVLPAGPAGSPRAFTEACPLESLPAGFSELRPARGDRSDSQVLVIVASGVETPLAPELSRFASDLEAEGYSVSTQVMTGGTAASLRALLQSTPGIGGAILVGDLPAAWYEMDEWSGPHEEFPMDLYLGDLDGTWGDSDGDGLLDSHGGDAGPEIWIGRIDAHAVEFGGEIEMLRDYFDKNHFYRTGALAVPGRALVFNDDDWQGSGSCGLDEIYGTVTLLEDPAQTTAAYYRDRLAYGYEFVHLMSHSSPWGHAFKVPSGYSGTVMAPEIAEINPQTVFVQLFACSNCRWTEPDCLGNWYLFGEDYCLLAIGSTKTGSMLEFEQFYGPIGAGSSPGVAFRDWFDAVGISDPAWHYGCVLLGDPTIMPLSSVAISAGLQAHGTQPRDYPEISTSGYSDCYPVAAGSGSDLWVAWMTGGTARLDIAARHFDGDSWGQVYIVEQDEYWDVTPSLAFDASGAPVLAWSSFDENTYGYGVRVATGPGFGSVVQATSGSGYDVDPKLVQAQGSMWLAWQTWRRADGDIMVKTLDGSFPQTFLSADGPDDFSPTAAADPAGQVHVAWVEGTTAGDRILWTAGGSGGFSPPVEISSGEFCRAPVLGMAGGQLFAAWQQDDDGWSIRARRWSGSAWEPEQVLFSSPSIAACVPSIGQSTVGLPVVAWQQGKGAGAEIWGSTLDGSSWTPGAQLVDQSGPTWLPSLANGVIVWAGTAGSADWDIYADLDGGLGTGEGGAGPGPLVIRLQDNPVTGDAVLLVSGADRGGDELGITVFDLAGRAVVSLGRKPDPSGLVPVPTGGLPSGIYVVRVSAGDLAATARITVLD